MDQAIKIEENISETTRLKEKIRSQARKIIQLQQRHIPPPQCQVCEDLKNIVAELKTKVEQLANLLKSEVVANEAMRTFIETSVESQQPVASDWRRFDHSSDTGRRLVDDLLRNDAASRKRFEVAGEQQLRDRQAMADDMADVVMQKADTDRKLLQAERRIEELLADVIIP